MDRQALSAVPGVLHDAGMGDIGHLLNHVEFAESIDLLLFSGQFGEFFALLVVKIANRTQPAVDQAELAILHRGSNTTATIVAGDQNVFDLEYVNRVLNHRQAVEVGVQHHIGHVAVYEQIARQHADDLVGRHPGIGTADPQVLGSLLASQLGEEVRIFFGDRVSPALVVVDQIL